MGGETVKTVPLQSLCLHPGDVHDRMQRRGRAKGMTCSHAWCRGGLTTDVQVHQKGRLGVNVHKSQGAGHAKGVAWPRILKENRLPHRTVVETRNKTRLAIRMCKPIGSKSVPATSR